MAPLSLSTLSTKSISALAILRILVGGPTLLLPHHATAFFGIPMASQTAILARLFGARELVLGGLLWSARAGSKDTSKTASDEEGRRALMQALRAGLATDLMDVCSCAVGISDGTLEGPAIVWVGGGAVFAVGLALVGLRGL